jgi:hypothetical protein
MKLASTEKREMRVEVCERCAQVCDTTCIAETQRDRIFERMLQYGVRPL